MDATVTVGKATAIDQATAPSSECVANMQSRFAALQTQQAAWYTQHKSPIPNTDNQSHLHIGTNGRAIVMVHGFLSSPLYLKDMADAFAKQGYTVVTPLLTGFGSDANAANSATVQDWKAVINSSFVIARTCSSSVSLIAHSLGSALRTQQIEEGSLTNLDRVVMLAPYFRTYSEWTKPVVDRLPLSITQIDIASIQAWLAPIGIQLANFKFTPAGNGNVLPMTAVRTILSLQDMLVEFSGVPMNVDMLSVVSMDDETIDSTFALPTSNFILKNQRLLFFRQAVRFFTASKYQKTILTSIS